jgi:hypothetical protein
MSVLLFVRRAHLYLGMFLLPWVIMFGLSSIPLNHTAENAPPQWTKVAELPFTASLPPSTTPDALRPLGEQMVKAAGLNGGFYVNRANANQINVNHPNFLHPIRIIYYVDRGRLSVERRDVAWRQFLSGMHTRGGYNLGGFWDATWAVFVDIVSVALLAWIASGLFMWWKLPGTGLRRWGWLALAGGLVSFALITANL